MTTVASNTVGVENYGCTTISVKYPIAHKALLRAGQSLHRSRYNPLNFCDIYTLFIQTKKGAEKAPWIVEFSFSSYIALCRDSCPPQGPVFTYWLHISVTNCSHSCPYYVD